ncbi:fungal-specific transcription factor domain-containing protein [Paraphoma chrysanthemicola]|uniref:Fungal-specific transcription factor domain-containing protein n=1 Tax=Paraphoma chrysanthemicola TaxID=798071 RepID=A0A8K0VYZ4_9PLEO|nr:fungal-specific transcription factor domain-containing protein [Paraphoma chrysanthemicola]
MQRARVCNMLVQIALSNSSRSSRAVHFAVLALSAYHRGDNPIYVETKKRSALRELYTDQEPSMCEAVTHIAANLILCILEMQQTSERNSRWVGYVCSTKHVIDAFNKGLGCPTPGSDASIILSWVYYFDIMFRFSLRHWRTENIKAMAEELGYATNGSPICELQYVMARASFARAVPNIGSHAHPVLRLLAEVSETALYSADPRYLTSKYQQELVDLRFDLENVSTSVSASSAYDAINICQALTGLGSDGGENLTPPTSAFAQDSSERVMDSEDALTSRISNSAIESLECTENVLEVTRLAALTYLERVSRNFSCQSNMIDSWTRKALGILDQMDSCLCPFALLVIGCEANCDDDRIIILDLFARMEKRPHLKSLLETKALIQTAWNQQDLAEDGELEYIHKLNVVLSSRFNIPSLI